MTQPEMDALPASLSVELFTPVKIGDQVISRVDVREPNRAQMREVLKKNAADQFDYAIYTCSGLLPAAVDQLATRDWHKMADWLAPFFQGPSTGGQGT